MVPKRVFDEIGGFPVGVRTGEDLDMWARIALQHRVAWSPRESAVYHLSSDNRTAGGEALRPAGCRLRSGNRGILGVRKAAHFSAILCGGVCGGKAA